MGTKADREPYWTPIEVVTWIRARDINQVSRVDHPTKPVIAAESEQVLNELSERGRSGSVRAVGRRCTYHDSMLKRSEPVGKPLLWKRRSEGAPSDITEGIAPNEWLDLEWELTVDGNVTGNLRSRSLRRRAWVMVQYSRSDVMRAWPSASSEAAFGFGATPVSEPEAFKPAPEQVIRDTIGEVYERAEAAGDKAPNIRELPPLVLRELHRKGYASSQRHIQKFGEEPEFKKYRRQPGAMVKSAQRARPK